MALDCNHHGRPSKLLHIVSKISFDETECEIVKDVLERFVNINTFG